MQLSEDGFNIVLAGQWNQAIFSPQWISRHLGTSSGQPQQQVTLAIPVGNLAAPLRITFDSFVLYPGPDRLSIHTSQPVTSASVTRCQQLGIRILELLPHTPLSALGVNFRLNDADNPDRVYSHFILDDAERMPADRYTLKWTDLRRQYQVSPQTALNLSVGYSPERVKLEFNFHSPVNSSTQAIERLNATPCSNRLTETLEFIEHVYEAPVAPIEQAAA